jgi:hypothetical protein
MVGSNGPGATSGRGPSTAEAGTDPEPKMIQATIAEAISLAIFMVCSCGDGDLSKVNRFLGLPIIHRSVTQPISVACLFNQGGDGPQTAQGTFLGDGQVQRSFYHRPADRTRGAMWK